MHNVTKLQQQIEPHYHKVTHQALQTETISHKICLIHKKSITPEEKTHQKVTAPKENENNNETNTHGVYDS